MSLETAPIRLHLSALARLWGVDASNTLGKLRKADIQYDTEKRYSLDAALGIRGIRVQERAFEIIVSAGTAIVNGMQYDTVEAARAQGIFALHSEGTTPETTEATGPVDALTRERASVAASDEYKRLKNVELKTKIDIQKLKAKRESGQMISRRRVDADLKVAGLIIKNALQMIPSEILPLVNPELKVEASRRMNDAIERSFFAVIAALNQDDDDELETFEE